MIFTSEQVSAGHPDKICDQISDAILTECLRQDKNSRVAVESMIKNFDIVLAGELTTTAKVDFERIVARTLHRIGLHGLDHYRITNLISEQSPDIAQGVDTGGAGDQGMMFGYATDETPEMLPIPFVLATRALQRIRDTNHPALKPDAKAQVSFDYAKNRIDTFLISTQHVPDFRDDYLYNFVSHIMREVAESMGLNTDFKVLVNPTGKFVIGSSFADSGLTGRKIIADTYGSAARHGGGAFSGKDPTKVDRSGAYIARKIAKDIVHNGFTKRCEVQIAYAIGVAEPVSINVECFGTNTIRKSEIEKYIRKNYDLTPKGIIEKLDLLNVDYNKVSSYGHFGKEGLPWERLE